MILVADASALIALASCNSLSLLDKLFGEVFVPDTVYSEITIPDKPQSSSLQVYLQDRFARSRKSTTSRQLDRLAYCYKLNGQDISGTSPRF